MGNRNAQNGRDQCGQGGTGESQTAGQTICIFVRFVRPVLAFFLARMGDWSSGVSAFCRQDLNPKHLYISYLKREPSQRFVPAQLGPLHGPDKVRLHKSEMWRSGSAGDGSHNASPPASNWGINFIKWTNKRLSAEFDSRRPGAAERPANQRPPAPPTGRAGGPREALWRLCHLVPRPNHPPPAPCPLPICKYAHQNNSPRVRNTNKAQCEAVRGYVCKPPQNPNRKFVDSVFNIWLRRARVSRGPGPGAKSGSGSGL